MNALTERIGLAGVAVLVSLTVAASLATGQLTTERFVPLGQSPGLSGRNTVIGTIQASDPAARMVTIGSGDGATTFSFTDRTRIWLDRSKIRRTNLVGTAADLRVGRRIEVKFETTDSPHVADWIKIEISTAN